MTTFTTDDRIFAEKDGSFTINANDNRSTITMTTTHTLYSASSLDRLALCPPSARLGKDIPDRSSKDAERGTRIHELGEMLLNGEDVSIPGIDADELKIAMDYAEYVWEVAGEEGIIYVEESFHEPLAIYHHHLGGTGDAVVLHGRDLHIIDLKTGKSPVSAKENKQMLTYGLGAIEKHGWERFDNVHLHIYQPGNISKESYPVKRLGDWARELVEIAKRADDPFEKPNPTAKGCFFCKAKTVCPAIQEKAVESAKQDFADNNLEKLLDDAKLAMTWAEAIMEQAKEQIANGADAGHWYLKAGRKMVSYKDKTGAEAYFAGNPNVFELKSPSALKKAGYEIPEQYLEEKVSAPSLVRKD